MEAVPDEVKDAVRLKLSEGHVFERMGESIKKALKLASSNNFNPSTLTPISNMSKASPLDKTALQTVYSFLAEHGMDATLYSLEMETSVEKAAKSPKFDLRSIVSEAGFPNENPSMDTSDSQPEIAVSSSGSDIGEPIEEKNVVEVSKPEVKEEIPAIITNVPKMPAQIVLCQQISKSEFLESKYMVKVDEL